MSNRIKKLEALERLWLSTESAGEKENAMVAMRTLAKRITEEENAAFNLNDWLARDDDDDDDEPESSPSDWFEVLVAPGAAWAGRLIELLAEQRAGGVTIRKSNVRGRGRRGWVYEIRGEAARETYEHFCEYRDKLFETDAYLEGEDEALNWAFEIIDLVKSEMVG